MKLEDMIDITVLKSIPNPATEPYKIEIIQPEITFMGVKEQRDFGTLHIVMYPRKKVIELKSLKVYLAQYHNKLTSYERFVNTVYDHLMEVYEPDKLKLVLSCNPRGGISSINTIDSEEREKAKAREKS